MYSSMSARDTITELKAVYTGNRFHFDSRVTMYVAGDHNKLLRQEIMTIVTGEKKPLSKCGLYAVSDALRDSFDQLSLF